MSEVFLKNLDGISDAYMMKTKNTGDVDLDYLLKCKGITKKITIYVKETPGETGILVM